MPTKLNEEFQDYLSNLKLGLKALKVRRDDVGIIASLRPTSRDKCHLFVDPEPRVGGLDDRTRSSLESIRRTLRSARMQTLTRP